MFILDFAQHPKLHEHYTKIIPDFGNRGMFLKKQHKNFIKKIIIKLHNYIILYIICYKIFFYLNFFFKYQN